MADIWFVDAGKQTDLQLAGVWVSGDFAVDGFPLCFQMPEEQAFCVLVKIMYVYGLRALYKNNFEDLHCKFYQLERLVQVRNK